MPTLRLRRALAPTLLVLSSTACVATTTQLAQLQPGVVEAEEHRQRVLVLETRAEQQGSLDDLGFLMTTRAVELCGEHVTPRLGLRVATSHAYKKEWATAAREALRLSDTLTVVNVAAGSAAARAGIAPGDEILAIGGRQVAPGEGAAESFTRALRHALDSASSSVIIDVRRDSSIRSLTLVPDSACSYDVVLTTSGDLNAYADGRATYVTTTMMRFASDEELPIIVAHELAHNAMGHIEAKKANAAAGAFLGLLADVALASYGVNTGGTYTSQFAELGAMTFSQDFEREADYVGLYIMALAGLPLEPAATFWRHMAQENPSSIGLARSHPTSAERFVRLDMAMREIEGKEARGEVLRPEMKDGAGSSGQR